LQFSQKPILTIVFKTVIHLPIPNLLTLPGYCYYCSFVLREGLGT
jgi:hypothetical protein